ncbi:hypothetical protein BGP_3681 [Beggiatoa sp. PS]|nr:hypothetical protein BGP_3681 [Beggiatoa sp. PS]
MIGYLQSAVNTILEESKNMREEHEAKQKLKAKSAQEAKSEESEAKPE